MVVIVPDIEPLNRLKVVGMKFVCFVERSGMSDFDLVVSIDMKSLNKVPGVFYKCVSLSNR